MTIRDQPSSVASVAPLPGLRHPRGGATTLYLIRHGHTAANQARMLQGVSDFPLDALGQRQAASLAERMRRELSVDVLLTSPLTRARETARIIGAQIGKESTVVAGLTEMNFGIFEGQPFLQVVENEPELAERLFDVSDDGFGWPGGDTRRDFHRRVWDTFQGILDAHDHQRVAVVSHGGVLGAFLALAQGNSPNDLSLYDLHNCSLTHLHVTANGADLYRRNDIEHIVESQAS